jgi:hypothetical protein
MKDSDVPILDRAKNHKAKNLDFDSGPFITIALGIGLGIAMGLVDHNLNNLRDQEQARVKMFINRKISSQMSQRIQRLLTLCFRICNSLRRAEDMDDYFFNFPMFGGEKEHKSATKLVQIKTPITIVPKKRGGRIKLISC